MSDMDKFIKATSDVIGKLVDTAKANESANRATFETVEAMTKVLDNLNKRVSQLEKEVE
jgi:hypothetical protein